MQRRNVLLPEPEGPIMHITSPGETSRSMPRSTSSRPKLLCTASALTMGVALMSSMPSRERHWQLRRRRRVEGKEYSPQPLDRRLRQLALRAPGEVPLEVKLSDRQDRGHEQIPDADDEDQLDDVEVGG